MKKINLRINYCPMSDETISEKVMIYKPRNSKMYECAFEELLKLQIQSVSDFVKYISSSDDFLMKDGGQDIKYSDVYIGFKDYYLVLYADKNISEIFDYLSTDYLEFSIFLVIGASIHGSNGYRYQVFSEESVHRYSPHVHVCKNGHRISYSLLTLSPFTEPPREYERDSKKIIIPFLKKNRDKLLEMWYQNLNGFETPTLDEDGMQFYSVS